MRENPYTFHHIKSATPSGGINVPTSLFNGAANAQTRTPVTSQVTGSSAAPSPAASSIPKAESSFFGRQATGSAGINPNTSIPTTGHVPIAPPKTSWRSAGKFTAHMPGLTGALAGLGVGALGTAGAGYLAAGHAKSNWEGSSWWSKLKSILSMLFGDATVGSTASKYFWNKDASVRGKIEVPDSNPYKF